MLFKNYFTFKHKIIRTYAKNAIIILPPKKKWCSNETIWNQVNFFLIRKQSVLGCAYGILFVSAQSPLFSKVLLTHYLRVTCWNFN